ncbi:MAG: hypothetical protein ACLSG9_10600 [Eubacterium sp.]
MRREKYASEYLRLLHPMISIKKKLDLEKVRIRIGFITVKSKEEKEKGDNRKKENYVSKIREKGEKSSGRANAAKGATKEKKDKKTLFISGGIGYNKLYHG